MENGLGTIQLVLKNCLLWKIYTKKYMTFTVNIIVHLKERIAERLNQVQILTK